MVREDGDDGRRNDNDTSSPSPEGEEEGPPPPLPPRPRRASFQLSSSPLQGKATTALSSVDIQTVSFPDGSRGTFPTQGLQAARVAPAPAATAAGAASGLASSGYSTPNLGGLVPGSATGGWDREADPDAMSVMSFAPTLRPPADLASLVAGEMNKKSPAWAMLRSQSATVQPFQRVKHDASNKLENFAREFDSIPDEAAEGVGDEERLASWKSKLKHYMILSSAGKPIWSRHGDLSLVNSYMGVVQTILSFYEGMKNPLQGFTAGDARFVVATEGPLYFVAISRLGESDAQLREQLRALYMQILSTLTLPALTRIFAHRPSTDLRAPLRGTESLLSSLADSFTRGSPTSLLGALECLRIRKSQRLAINNLFLRARAETLLYGLIVAGGRLVSVIRPRRHSLHPSDLQLIFNMLFESGGIRAGGGENWVPLCLPAFNSSGYLYMYVSFFDGGPQPGGGGEAAPQSQRGAVPAEEETAIILISPDRESFYDLKEMRDKVAASLARQGSLNVIRQAARAGRPRVTSVAPGSQITHFLYKSRANVQFCMSSLDPVLAAPAGGSTPPAATVGDDKGGSGNGNGQGDDGALVPLRRLMTLYHQLHAAVHARHSHLRVLHCASRDAASLGWVTPSFEFYCVAGPNASRAVMTQGANKITQWARKEEERLFIIGGGVF